MNRFAAHVIICCLLLIVSAAAAAQDIPEDATIAFGSNREGSRHEIFLIKPDGTGLTRVTTDGGTNPTWSPDGTWILYYHPTNDHGRVIRPDGTGDKKICNGTAMGWLHDGSGAFCDEWIRGTVTDPATGQQTVVYETSDFPQLAGADFEARGVTHDGRYVVGWSDRYRDGYDGSNGSFQAEQAAIVLDLQDKSKLYFLGEGCEPTTPPTGDLIYHVRGDGPTGPDIYRMSIKDLASRSSYQPEMAHADADWGHEYCPRISTDNKWLTYAATTGCHNQDECDYEVFVHRIGAGNGNRTQVTTNPANDQWPHLFVKAPPPAPDGGPPDDAAAPLADSAPSQPDGPPLHPADAGTIADANTNSGGGGGGGGGCFIAAQPELSLLMLLILVALFAVTRVARP